MKQMHQALHTANAHQPFPGSTKKLANRTRLTQANRLGKASSTCRVLVAGSCHAYAYGIPFERGFVQRTLTDIGRAGQKVRVDYYTPMKIMPFVGLLQRDPALLNAYDLIVLQFGHFELLNRSLGDLFQTNTNVNAGMYGTYNAVMDAPTSPSDVARLHTCLPNKCGPIADGRTANGSQSLGQHLRAWLASTCVYGVPFPYLKQVARQWSDLLDLLSENRDRVVLVSPLPTADPMTNSLRAWGRQWLRREAGRRHLSIIDPAGDLRADGACLLADGFHLNSRGHFLVYQALGRAVPVRMLTSAVTAEAGSGERYRLGFRREHQALYDPESTSFTRRSAS